MGQGMDARAVARARLAERIELLAHEVSHLSAGRVAFAVDDIRREAQAAQLQPVATLASGLERAMASTGGAAIVLPYLEAMSDALTCDTAHGTEALMASVSLRLHG
jgi:hypothetical protein